MIQRSDRPAPPSLAAELHRKLTPKFERWAKQRLESTRVTEASLRDIAGTEWPLFGSVFYLWATEALQNAWQSNHEVTPTAPRKYAKGAVEAATKLVIDPSHASWVKRHWGPDYLEQENVFYRMLLIAALTSYKQITGEQQHRARLRHQVESLSREIASSEYGLLDDYPGQCYPGDVMAAIAMIRRADQVLGTDHSDFVERAIRGFRGQLLDSRGLVPYAADAQKGELIGPSRGCGNAYVSLFAPALWPEQARRWYRLHTRYFWQETWLAVGFREFPNDTSGPDWYLGVDAGPVLDGFGFAASAFGVGAARANGRFDHAFPLTAELYAASWPLPDGTLLIPRLLSKAAKAPYLGEAAILFNLTRSPANGMKVKTGGAIPAMTFIILGAQATAGLLLLLRSMANIKRRLKAGVSVEMCYGRLQLAVWGTLVATGIILYSANNLIIALLPLLLAQLLPRGVQTSLAS